MKRNESMTLRQVSSVSLQQAVINLMHPCIFPAAFTTMVEASPFLPILSATVPFRRASSFTLINTVVSKLASGQRKHFYCSSCLMICYCRHLLWHSRKRWPLSFVHTSPAKASSVPHIWLLFIFHPTKLVSKI